MPSHLATPLVPVQEAWGEASSEAGSEAGSEDWAGGEGESEDAAAQQADLAKEFERQCALQQSPVPRRRSTFKGQKGSRALRESLLAKKAGQPSCADFKRYSALFNNVSQEGLHRDASGNVKLGKEFQENEEDWNMHNGPLIDFLMRHNKSRASQELRPVHPHDVLARVVGTSAGRGSPDQEEVSTGYLEAIQAVNREMLFSGIYANILAWNKENSTPGWMAKGGELKAVGSKIFKMKKEVACLRAEVDNWILRHTLLRAKPGAVETQRERHDRLQEFWAQFHEVPRKLEVRKDFQSKDAQTRALLQPLEMSPEKGLEVKNRPCQDLSWKSRGSRSRCTAGAWDWSRGSSRGSSRPATTGSGLWRYDDAPDFSSERGDGHARTPPSKTNSHRWWEMHQPPKETVSPHVTRIKGMATNIPNTNVAMLKSKSLPFLGSRMNSRKSFAALEDHFPMPEADELLLPGLGKPQRPKLAPIANAFQPPWQGKTPVPTLKCEETPTKRYLINCKAAGTLPRPLSFITGHSTKLDAGHPDSQSLFDSDLTSLVDMMKTVHVEDLDLEGNMLLSEKALVSLIKTLADTPGALTLHSINLKRCSNAGQLVTDIVIKMLTDMNEGCRQLKFLDLSSIPIGIRRHLPLSRAVGSHPTLETLHLADTGLGVSPDPGQCIHSILGSKSIHTLDLGWNAFSEEVFDLLGERLVQINFLKKLSIANCCSAGRVGHASPIVFFIEHLSNCMILRDLDVSLNRIDFRGALVLEDALESRKCVTMLNLSHNPLGYLGMRSLLRLLVRSSSGLVHFNCEDCSSGKSMDTTELYQVFSCNNPGARYTLDLQRPYHRSILRMLYKTCEKYQLEASAAFSDLKGSPTYSHAQKGDCGIWIVPKKGSLTATFSIDKAVEDALKAGAGFDEWDFTAFWERYASMMRVQPAFHKVIPLLAQWKSVDGHLSEQICLLQALAKDFQLTYPQIEQMSDSRSILMKIIGQLLPSVDGGQVSRYMTMLLIPSLSEYVTVLRSQHALLTFNIENPNGHYKLDLETAAEYSVAERLLLLDRWEIAISRRLNRVDTSQKGNLSQIRNVRYQQRPMAERSIQEWKIRETDELEFDYSSGKRCSANAVAIDSDTFRSMLVTLQNSDCTPQDQVGALQMSSHLFYLTSVQMRSLLGIYSDKQARVDLFVLFFLRILDMYNEKIYRVRFEDAEELVMLSIRLGWVTLFPFIQPEQAVFKLDFSVYDERLAANTILALSGKESKHNLREFSLIYPDGSKDPFTLGIPRSWDDFKKMPEAGKFTVSYVCAPEDINYAARSYFYEKYGYREAVPKEEVSWWADISAAPEDVVEYLSFLVAKYDSVRKGFHQIDGPGGNGVISLREFEEGYKEMNCRKFEGGNEKQRVAGIFRYLDSSDEGQVSEDEWMVLDLLWKEIKLSITEFVQFCERTFGDDLAATWVFFDNDGGGEIDLNEWKEACKQVGYFGPVEPIFKFLDFDDEGTISYGEFKLLESFQGRTLSKFIAS